MVVAVGMVCGLCVSVHVCVCVCVLHSYEFSFADLRAGATVVDEVLAASGSGGGVSWEFIHGLFESAIYGGRVDNSFDGRVLTWCVPCAHVVARVWLAVRVFGCVCAAVCVCAWLCVTLDLWLWRWRWLCVLELCVVWDLGDPVPLPGVAATCGGSSRRRC